MMFSSNDEIFPEGLVGSAVSACFLQATDGSLVDLSNRAATWSVVYCYPRTSSPAEPSSEDWSLIPGAKGCTPQTCAFRDNYQRFLDIAVEVFGLSTQSTSYQKEMVDRLHVPYPILSDADLRLTKAMALPTFEVQGVTLLRRLTMVLEKGRVRHVFYPVQNPESHSDDVLRWFLDRDAGCGFP